MKLKLICYLLFLSHLFIRFGYKTLKIFFHIGYFFEALWVGFWLGVLKRNTLIKIDKLQYNKAGKYYNDNYNKNPLYDWEKIAIANFFKECKTIMVIGAGGGREVYNLEKMGYYVEGFECNEKMCEYANAFLLKEGMNSKVMFAPADKVPATTTKYDAVIVGWGAYTHIKGTNKRNSFLKDLSELLNINGVILISFFKSKSSYLNLGLISGWGNFWAGISENEKIERGDCFVPFMYVHYFSKEEISKELNGAGFEMIYYNDKDYGHAIGKKK